MITRQPFDAANILPRMLAEIILQAQPSVWRKRAAQFREAAPRPDDYTGRATPEQIAEQTRRMTAKAEACDNRAALCELTATEEHLIFELIHAARTDLERLQAADRHHELGATA